MSYHHKRRRSRSLSRSSTNKREAQPNRHLDRSIDDNRYPDSYERNHHLGKHLLLVQSTRQYDYYHPANPPVLINDIISHTEKYPPGIQSLVRELLLEQKKRKLIEERLNLCEHDYTLLRTQHEQTINSLTLLKHDFDQCRLNLKNSSIELNELRHSSCQYRLRIDQLLLNERHQTYDIGDTCYTKRQRRH